MATSILLGATAAVALLASTAGYGTRQHPGLGRPRGGLRRLPVDVSAALAFNYQGFLDYSISVDPAIPGHPDRAQHSDRGRHGEHDRVPQRGDRLAVAAHRCRRRSAAWSRCAARRASSRSTAASPSRSIAIRIGRRSTSRRRSASTAARRGSTRMTRPAPRASRPRTTRSYRLIVTNTGNVALVERRGERRVARPGRRPGRRPRDRRDAHPDLHTPGFEALNSPGRCRRRARS